MQGLTTQELLDLLEESSKSEQKPQEVASTPIDGFISNLNIEHGEDKVPTHVIYYTYCQTAKEPISKVHFFKLFSKKFTLYRKRHQRCYLLNPQSFDLSREGLLLAEKFNNDYKKKR